MANHAADDFDGNIFIYRGGRAPRHVTHARIDKSIDEIEENAFNGCENLVSVDTHGGLRRVGNWAFYGCRSLRRINLKSVVEIDELAFCSCRNLESVEFGDKLETIEALAFAGCISLKHLKLQSIISIKDDAFRKCESLIDIELSERLETIGERAFKECERLQRIALPLKRDLFEFSNILQRYTQFDDCEQLATVDLVGQAYTQTVASLHMKTWTNEMFAEINRINRVLPTTPTNEETDEIRQWMESIIDKMDHYKAEHCRYVKEGITLLELALWKTKLGEKEDRNAEKRTKKATVDADSNRRDKRITCGADIVIKNVLPFLLLE